MINGKTMGMRTSELVLPSKWAGMAVNGKLLHFHGLSGRPREISAVLNFEMVITNKDEEL